MTQPAVPSEAPDRRRGRVAWVLAVVAGILLAGALALRLGPATPQGRRLIEAALSGRSIGPLGTLRLEGLYGDIWRHLNLRRLTLADRAGVWLEVDNLSLTWRSEDLLLRRFHAEDLKIQTLRVLRRPTLGPAGPSEPPPVSVILDRVALRARLEPAFSGAPGDYDVNGAYRLQRRGGQAGHVEAASRLHASDFLKADIDLAKGDRLSLTAWAREASGGALAGALGLDHRQPFTLQAQAKGTMSAGRFHLDAAVGADHPLAGDGRWDRDGGAAHGELDLGASSLTQGYAARFGRKVVFDLAGSRRPDGLYALQGRLAADNLSVLANGLGDIGKRRLGPGGVRLTLASPDLARVTSGPKMGAAHVDGVVTGEGARWALDGAGSVATVDLGDYRLAEVGGPVHVGVETGQLLVRAKMAGKGGQGSGLIAGLLGASPTLSAEFVRMRDGRLLLRNIDGAGQGVSISGDGDRGLLGGLGFKGNVSLTRLESLGPGARGRLSAKVTANQASPTAPWTLAVDARGDDFASERPELDRLLGEKPTATLRGALAGQALIVSAATLVGDMAKANAQGVIDPGKLALRVEWSATGPFRAGPLEIAGAAKGGGDLTGTLAAPALKLNADFDSIDLPQLPLRAAHLDLLFQHGPGGSDGQASLAASSAYGPARAQTTFHFAGDGLDLTDLEADAGGVSAKGALSLRQARPSSADLSLAIGPGVLLAGGKIGGVVRLEDAAGGPRASVALTAENALSRNGDLSLTTARINAAGALADLPLTIQARGAARPGRWRVDLTGRLSAPAGAGYGLSLDGKGELGRSTVSTREPAVLRWQGGAASARLRLMVGEGAADIDLRRTAGDLALSAVLKGADLSALNEDLAGEIDARLAVNGRGRELGGTLQASLRRARERGAPIAQSLDGDVTASLAANVLRVSAAAATPQGLRADAQFTLPAVASASPLRLALDRTRPMAVKVQASGEVKPLWNLLVGGERSLSGHADLSASVAGTLAEPQISGQGNLERGTFEDGASGLKLNAISIHTLLSEAGVELQSGSADDGSGGRVTASGRFDLRRGAQSSLKLDLRGFRLIDNNLGSGSASGEATLSRNADGRINLAGALTIDRADLTAATPTPTGVVALDVIERNRPADLQPDLLRSPPQRGPGMAFDLTLKAPRRVFVRGRGLDVELSLDAHLTGNSNDPLLTGTARVVRGEYDFAGKRFEFDPQGVVYLGSSPELIRLDLTAVREDTALTATVNIKGTAARPEITLSSSPALPNDEVLSQVLFGASAAQLSPLEAAQLASALAALSGGGGFDVIGNLRSLARLDRLSFAGDAAGGMTVAGGKYVTDDVYLEVIGGGREGPAAQVEWRVRRNLSLVSRFSASQDSRLSVRWRRDY